jgi:hypothetical protein
LCGPSRSTGIISMMARPSGQMILTSNIFAGSVAWLLRLNVRFRLQCMSAYYTGKCGVQASGDARSSRCLGTFYTPSSHSRSKFFNPFCTPLNTAIATFHVALQNNSHLFPTYLPLFFNTKRQCRLPCVLLATRLGNGPPNP